MPIATVKSESAEIIVENLPCEDTSSLSENNSNNQSLNLIEFTEKSISETTSIQEPSGDEWNTEIFEETWMNLLATKEYASLAFSKDSKCS